MADATPAPAMHGGTQHPVARSGRFPPRYARPALVGAAAVIVIAVIGGTLWWQGAAGGGGIAVVAPSGRPSPTVPQTSFVPPASSPEPGDGFVTAYRPIATLEPERASGGVVELDTSFRLAGLADTPTTELAARLSVQPSITYTTTVEPDGRVRLTPNEPLTEGVTYRFTLAGATGGIADAWAFQARQPLHVVSTVPSNLETDVRLDTGIEIMFDQDGVTDPSSHMTIEPKVGGRFEQHGRVLSFVPDHLAPATIYTVTVTRGVKVEVTGEILEHDVRFRFETARTAPEPADRSFLRFSTDLFESAVAERPVIGLWWFGDDRGDKTPDPPASLALEIFRFADRDAAIDAFQTLRDVPAWSTWNADQRVPTAALTQVARTDARLQDNEGTLWTALPEALPAGWYLVQHRSAIRQVQAVLQVTDISGYLAVSGTKTVVWANDLAPAAPLRGATVGAAGTTLGLTNDDGLLLAHTPSAMLPADGATCEAACTPVVTISSGGRSAFLPASGGAGPEGEGGWQDLLERTADPHHWVLFDTDRFLYRRTDTVHIWGMVRDRVTGAVPRSVSMRLLLGEAATDVPVTTTAASPRPTGAFTGSLALEGVPTGFYSLELVVDGDVIATRGLRVDRILKPAYKIEIQTGRRVYVVGDRIRVDAAATFLDGTPVPSVPLRLGGEVDARRTTDATGRVVVRTTARWPRYGPSRDDPLVTSVEASPGRAEEGEIVGATRDFVIFPSSWIVRGQAASRAGRVQVSGTLDRLDRDRVERQLLGGSQIWQIDPAGSPVRAAGVRARITELIPIRIQAGTSYDFIEKRVVPVYSYDIKERSVGSLRLTTDARGRFSGSIAIPDMTHDYRVTFEASDPDRLSTTATAYAGPADGVEPYQQGASLVRTDGVDQYRFSVGEAVDLTMREPVERRAAGDRHLFFTAQVGIRGAVVRPSSRFRTVFPTWGPPNLDVYAVRFTGKGYVVTEAFRATFRESDRAMRVELSSDRTRYAPGERVRLSVRTLDARGKPMPASVILRAVDEKLFLIGGAASDDPLRELYAQLSGGLRATYATHAAPQPADLGGDTGGGGDTEGDHDTVLFRAVDTDRNGRAVVSFDVPSDLTAWRVSASGVGAGLEAGRGALIVPVGLPFFVGVSLAPEYLAADRPTIQIRGFGSALAPGDRVTMSVDSRSLGLHAHDLRGLAFRAVNVTLPKLTAGTHDLTITARAGTGTSARRYTLRRSFVVVRSRLTRTRTSDQELSGTTRFADGGDVTDLLVWDAGTGPQSRQLMELVGLQSVRLERALAADIAAARLEGQPGDPAPTEPFDGGPYERADGGISAVPGGSSDLEISSLAALAAPERFSRSALREYFRGIMDDPDTTRERRDLALAALGGMGETVMAEIRAALADPDLTVRERLMLAIGVARLGDRATARAVAADLAAKHAEAASGSARLRVDGDSTDISTATALMAMLLAATGDPLAARYWEYVDANRSDTVPFELHQAAYATWLLDASPATDASFAYVIDGNRHVVSLSAGKTSQLRFTGSQLARLTIEPLTGRIGVTRLWRAPVGEASIGADPDLKITRLVRPSGAIPQGALVIVDHIVTFGRQAPNGCHRVIEHVPSGLVPVGRLAAYEDPEGNEEPVTGLTYPESQDGQLVIFCAEPTKTIRTVRLRYVARVISTGTYRWEPAIVESRTDPDRGAIVPTTSVRIR